MEKIENIDLNALRDRVYENACKHGWYDEMPTEQREVMLIVSEMSEAVNADRKGKYADRLMFEKNFDTPQIDPEGHWKFCYKTFIKDTVEDEIADTFLRLLSYSKHRDINILPTFFTELCIENMHSFMIREVGLPEQLYTVLFTIVDGDGDRVSLALVRLIVLARINDIDLLWHIEQKMKYNEMRPYKHGGKKY